MNPVKRFFRLPPSIRIAIYYLLFAAAWILASDQTLGEFQTLKGLGFVTVSGIGLGYIIHRNWRAHERSEHRFKAVVENAGDIVSIIDADGIQTYQSPAVERVLGYPPSTLIGQNIIHYTHLDDRDRARAFLQEIMMTPGAMASTELRVIGADGQVRHLRSTATNLLEDPSVNGVLLNTRDVTERKLAQQQIAQQLARLQALHEIDLAILESRQLQDTLDVVLDQVVDKLDIDAADVLLYDQRNQILEFSRGIGFPTDGIQQSRLPVGNDSVIRGMLSRQPKIVPNIEEIDDGVLRSAVINEDGFIGYAAVPLIAKSEIKGVLELFTKSPLEPSADWRVFADALGAQTAIAIDNAQMVESLQQANDELEEVYDRTLEGWAAALELCDDETEGHSRRVVGLTLLLAEHMGVGEDALVHIRRGALLHDIGKIGVPDTILLKPGPLDDDEWEAMRQHPTYAYDLLKSIPYLRPALDIPRYHHERWDGSGYPEGLSGQSIPLHARIFMVVDVYDALVSDRPYRQSWDREAALQYIRDQAGRIFDPDICDAFLEVMEVHDGRDVSQMSTREAESTAGMPPNLPSIRPTPDRAPPGTGRSANHAASLRVLPANTNRQHGDTMRRPPGTVTSTIGTSTGSHHSDPASRASSKPATVSFAVRPTPISVAEA
ncbi:MAG: HD domain-containing phosphohydrolase [Thermomicrobiales bacterium]